MRGHALIVRMRILSFAVIILVCAVAAEAAGGPARDEREADATARMLLSSDGVRTGLCLHLECGNGVLTAALHRNGAHIVHGITSDRSALEDARRYIHSQGLYGPVAVAYCDMKELPYADGIANVIVAEDYAALSGRGTDVEEIMRVLAPYGTAFLKGFKGTVAGASTTISGEWAKISKPRQPGADEWTHFEHDPERTSVSHDTAFQVPTGLRWISGMFYPYSMMDVGFASTAGRNFYWYWAHHVAHYGRKKAGSKIICRDAFSGAALWERETERSPRGASFVGIKDRLYVHLGGPGGLVALDARTGKEVLRFKDSRDHPLSEIIVKDGVLVQCADGIRAFDVAKGDMLWEKPNGLMTTDLMMTGEGKLYYLFRESRDKPTFLVCCDLPSGKEEWRLEQSMEYKESNFTESLSLIAYHRGVILLASGSRREFMNADNKFGALYAVSAEDGRLMWTYKYDVVSHKGTPTDVFPIGDDVWLKTRNPETVTHGIYVSLDLKTGKEKKKIGVGYNRCYPDRASTRYLLTGNFDFVSLRTGETHAISAARGHCNTGFMVAHGLTYAFPSRCTCFNLTRGFMALSGTGASVPAEREDPVPLKGPAYGTQTNGPSSTTDWPTFRHDPQRSNSTSAAIPGDLRQEWDASLGGRLSSLTISRDTVFVSSVDDHRILALDSGSGKLKWSFTAGGRVDSPPTAHKGLVLFGSADGWIYGVAADDGRLAWKLQAAPADRRIPVRGQMESLWPLPGSVLVSDDTLYFAAGYNNQMDGGMYYYAADAATGRVKWKKNVGRQLSETTNDVMIRGDKSIHLGHRVHFDPKDGTIAKYGGEDEVLFAPFGLVVDCLTNGPVAREDILRRQWGYGRVRVGGRPRQAVTGKNGRYGVIAVDKDTVYGVTEDYEFNWEEGRVWARMLSIRCLRDGDGKGWEVKPDASLLMRALVATADKLVLALRPEGKEDGELWLLSKTDGHKLATVQVAGVPRWDGLAVADGKVFVVTDNGHVACFTER